MSESNSGNSTNNSGNSNNNSGNSNNNSENGNNIDRLDSHFHDMLARLADKLLANGVRSTRVFLDKAEELRNFIDAGNPDAPFDVFSAAELGAELYHEVESVSRYVIQTFPINQDRVWYQLFIRRIFAETLVAHRREHPGNMQNGGRRRKSRRGLRKQRNTRRR